MKQNISMEELDIGKWETVIDFTENGKTDGVDIKDALEALGKVNIE